MQINLEDNSNYDNLKKQAIHITKEYENDFYIVKIKKLYKNNNEKYNSHIEKEEYKYENKLEIYKDILMYLSSKNYLMYEPTKELLDFYYKCDENTSLFNIRLKDEFIDNIKIIIRINDLKYVEDLNQMTIDMKEIDSWLKDYLYSKLKVNVQFDYSFITFSDDERHIRNYRFLRLIYLVDSMLQESEKGLNIYLNDKFNKIFFCMKNFEVKYLSSISEIDTFIKESKYIVCKFIDTESDKVVTYKKIFKVDKNSKTIISEINSNILSCNIKKYEKITIFKDNKKELLIICFYEINEKYISIIEKNVTSIKKGWWQFIKNNIKNLVMDNILE